MDGNRELIRSKEMKKRMFRNEDNMFFNQIKQTDFIREQDEVLKKNAHLDQKKMYRETLENQIRMAELNKKNYGKMTWHEKKLNKLDLESYKSYDESTVHCMIPGIKNQPGVGDIPLQRGAVQNMNYPKLNQTGESKGQIFLGAQGIPGEHSRHKSNDFPRGGSLGRPVSNINPVVQNRPLDANQFSTIQ